jgi:predicted ATPase
MQRYAVTGAPGAGKTAVIRQLEIEGFGVVEEAATDVIALSQAKGIDAHWTRPEFIEAIVRLQQSRERRSAGATDRVQFHDRSVVCTAALADYLGFRWPHTLSEELRRIQAEHIFEPRVVFLKNLGFVTPTNARRITYEQAVQFERIHEETYRNFGFDVIHIGPASVSDRVTQIKRALSLDPS